ncbi:MAG: energy-coupling factor transporter transmembrane protein EcfT [Oscillospiraceae bacterium]|nr:energy-coupling factor transporter transmembrane protein EcfT [Oscillospiraceae bacterium]
MIKDITIGQFFPGKSFIHKMDARAKFSLMFAFIIIIFVCKNLVSLGIVFGFALFMIILSKVAIKTILKSFKMIVFIIILTSALQIFYNSKGTVLFDWWKIKVTDIGMLTALFMAVRIITLILSSSLLTYTTSPTLLTDAIERLFSPLKILRINVSTLAMMMTIALRFIPILIDEVDRIMSAQKARGADLETGGLIKRAKALLPIFIPLFVNSFRRAFELAYAMECRCYKGGEGRTRMTAMKMHIRDFFAVFVIAGLLAGVIWVNRVFVALI